jgi:hypothetical protein
MGYLESLIPLGIIWDIGIYCPGGKSCLSSILTSTIGNIHRHHRWISPRVVPSSVPPAGTQAVRRYVRRYGTYFSIGSTFVNSSTPNSTPNSRNITAVQLGWNINTLTIGFHLTNLTDELLLPQLKSVNQNTLRDRIQLT